MSTFPASRPIRLALVGVALAFLFSLSPLTQAQNPPPVIGSQNTVTPDPRVTRPHEQPCIVQLFSDLQFVDFSIKTYQYTAACRLSWTLGKGRLYRRLQCHRGQAV
jgi:hypothetical protein